MNLVAVSLAVAMAAPASGHLARPHEGPSSIQWPADRADAPPDVVAPSRDDETATESKAKKSKPPPPRLVNPRSRIRVAVGLGPEAPGSKRERELVAALERGAVASVDPPAVVRKHRPGTADARTICREKRDDLVIQIGYVPDRDDPVILAHDCRLDRALGLRRDEAAADARLVAALWDEHDDLVRAGVKERRRIGRLSPKARIGIGAGVALVVVGVAVGVLVANALRDDKVVLKVSP